MFFMPFALFFKTTGSIFFGSALIAVSLNPKNNKRRKKTKSQVAAQEQHSNKREGRIINERLESEIEFG